MAAAGKRRIFGKLRTAAGLAGRVVAVEDQSRALEAHVQERLDEVRFELAEIRRLLEAMNSADQETAELTGRLLRAAEGRLDALEDQLAWNGRGALSEIHEVPSA